MKTIVAYLVSIVILLVIEPIIVFLFFPILAYLRKIDAQLVYWLEGIISTIVSCFTVVFLSVMIFNWLSVKYSLLPIIIMLTLSSINNINRLKRFKGTDRYHNELSYTIGDTVGFTLGAMYFLYNIPFGIIVSIAAVPVVILIFCLLISRTNSLPFWKLASNLPDQAYNWFLNDGSCWIIYDPPSGKEKKPEINGYSHGLSLFVPSLGRKITVYGKMSLIEESEKQFLEQYANDRI